MPVTTVPPAEFERLAGLAADVVEQIVTLLDEQDADAGEGAGPLAWCPERSMSEVVWLRGADRVLDHRSVGDRVPSVLQGAAGRT